MSSQAAGVLEGFALHLLCQMDNHEDRCPHIDAKSRTVRPGTLV